jgi:hypothetical protein
MRLALELFPTDPDPRAIAPEIKDILPAILARALAKEGVDVRIIHNVKQNSGVRIQNPEYKAEAASTDFLLF